MNATIVTVDKRELLETLRSLRIRSLAEQDANGFLLQNVVTEYVTDRFVRVAAGEFAAAEADVLDSHPLLMATAKTYVRDAQERLLLAPVVERLRKELGESGTDERLRTLLLKLQDGTPDRNGYAAGNVRTSSRNSTTR